MGYLVLEDSKFAVKKETTEGSLITPASATDGFVQLKRSGADLEGNRDTKERGIINGTLADSDPRLGIRHGKGSFEVEMRGSGTEGVAPNWGILLESILPNKNVISGQITTKTGHDTETINIEDADISKLPIGACIVVLQAGAYWPCAVKARTTGTGTASITVTPARGSNFDDGVLIAKATTYLAADSGHPSFSAHAWWGSGASGGGIHQSVAGARVSAMTMDKFNTGELPALKFAFEGMDFTYTPATDAPYTPTYDNALPGVVLGSKIFKNGVEIAVEGVGLSITQPLAWLKSTGNANGLIAGRATGTRKNAIKIAPYSDGTSIATFTAWEAGTDFSMFGFTALPDPTTGVKLGSIVMFYCPAVFVKKPMLKSFEGILTDEIDAIATGGPVGTDLDIAIGVC